MFCVQVHADVVFLWVHGDDLLRVLPDAREHRVQGFEVVRDAHLQGDQVRVGVVTSAC